jgi:uncharacterized protein (DUF2235 family)
MARNLVLCCDGTANEFKQDRTNVVKLCGAMIKDRNTQSVYYHPGIGTMAAPGFVTKASALFARVAGKAFGYGLKGDICAAYTFLMNHYRPGDDIYLFGFSRGAYTARAVAAMLDLYGIVPPGNEGLVPYAVRMFWAIAKNHNNKAKVAAYFKLAREFKQTLGADCPVHFVGVWDTVSSVGWVGSPVSLPFTRSNPDIRILRHAVSIDEHRAFFPTNLAAPRTGQDFKEVWFPGVHCDVGGGYHEEESGLSKIALEWMATEAIKAGLKVDGAQLSAVLGANPAYAKPDAHATLHNSLTAWWWPCEFVPKHYYDAARDRVTLRMNFFRRRPMGVAPCVHDAAWARGADYMKRIPVDAVPMSQKYP